jgi:hypothetical protein
MDIAGEEIVGGCTLGHKESAVSEPDHRPLFAVQQADGTFHPRKGEWKYEEGKGIVWVNIEGVGAWGMPGRPLPQISVWFFSWFSTGPFDPPIDPKRVPCKVRKLVYADGKAIELGPEIDAFADLSQMN